uniref:Motilin n=1 Tax=Accipiter nisus TaxID=211598 RepID=A0A8B9NEP3_9AVES
MVSKKVVVSLLLVYVVSMLAEQTKGFMPFFTKSDFQKMQEKERNEGGQKKSLTDLTQSGTDVNKVKTIQLAVPVRAGMWLAPRHLEKYQNVLEKLLAETLQDTPDGTVRRLISALGILPFPPLTSSLSQRYLYSSEGLLCHVCSLYRILRYPTCSHVHTFLLGRLFTLLGCCLCPRADIDC